MPKQTINVGTAPNDGTGDTLKTSFTKTNDNFTELYNLAPAAIPITACILRLFATAGSFTYTPTAGMKFCKIECVGGGGGGGGCANTAAGTLAMGGGGGGGEYRYKWATAAQIGASQLVVVGVAGQNDGGTGGQGGQSSVGTLCVANGGLGGAQNGGATWVNGGVGGSGGTGDFGITGQAGLFGNASSAILPSGGGGSSPMGFGYGGMSFVAPVLPTTGGSATGYGGGGAGGQSYNAAGGANGGQATQGIVVITEYL